MRFGCVSDALSAFYFFGRGILWGIHLAPARTDTPTDPPTEKNALIPGKVRFFSVGGSVRESVGECVGGSVWPGPCQAPLAGPGGGKGGAGAKTDLKTHALPNAF